MNLGEEDKVDKRTKALKELTLVRNLHNLNPAVSSPSDAEGINIINALKSDPILQSVALQLRGYFINPITKKPEAYRKAVMNDLGIGSFLADIEAISKTIEFSSFKEKEIPAIVNHLFRQNYPFYTIYWDVYDLDRKDFNLIATILFTCIISSFKKAQGAGHRNVVRGTYSEDLMGKYAMTGNDPFEDKGKGSFSFMNPFRKSRGAA